MEMTEYGKHGKPRSRLPTLLGNPFGITTFPRPRVSLSEFRCQTESFVVRRDWNFVRGQISRGRGCVVIAPLKPTQKA
jgi:hypothetical protein